MAQPIFVLGKHRSGTTWLANQLCQHSSIAGVTHERHEGIHESAYFTWIDNRYGDLSVKNNYMEFVEVMSASDYFQLAGVSKEFLYSLWPTTYTDVFQAIMDQYAVQQQATAWVEKSPSHTLVAKYLAEIYPDAKFIAVIRNIEDAVASMVAKSMGEFTSKRDRWRFIAAAVLSWVFYNKTIKSFATGSDRILTVRYEALRTDLTITLQSICAFLALPYEASMGAQAFTPNTSYQGIKRNEVLSDREKRFIRVIYTIYSLIPLWTMTALYKMTKINKRRDLPWWFFKLHPFHEIVGQSAEFDTLQSVEMDNQIRVSKYSYH